MKKNKLIKTTKNMHQSGKTPNFEYDVARMAMQPGLRISSSGKMYWETRKNRSDKDVKRRI